MNTWCCNHLNATIIYFKGLISTTLLFSRPRPPQLLFVMNLYLHSHNQSMVSMMDTYGHGRHKESMKATHVYISASGMWNPIPGGIDPCLATVGIRPERKDKGRHRAVNVTFEPSTSTANRTLESALLKLYKPYFIQARKRHFSVQWEKLQMVTWIKEG